MIQSPSPEVVLHIEGLIPIEILIAKLIENLKGTEKHGRKSTVTVTYSLAWDEDHRAVGLEVVVKSKRPTRADRNEEWLGEPMPICEWTDDTPGQQRFDDEASAP